jgi:hypothetical protein
MDGALHGRCHVRKKSAKGIIEHQKSGSYERDIIQSIAFYES